MTQPMDLDAYFKRIGYGGPREATLEVLRALHTRHTTTIPFENLTPLMGSPVDLDLDALQAKFVGQRRGGYCFEQNALFKAALDALGFQVTGLGARVRWMAPPDAPLGARSHMLLKVDLADGPWLADVGFGGHILAEPIRLATGIDQAAPAATLRLADVGDGALMLRTLLPTGWQDVYRFDLIPQQPADYHRDPSRLHLRQCPSGRAPYAGSALQPVQSQTHHPLDGRANRTADADRRRRSGPGAGSGLQPDPAGAGRGDLGEAASGVGTCWRRCTERLFDDRIVRLAR